MHQLQIGVLLEAMENKAASQSSATSFSSNSYNCPYCKTGTMIRIMSFDANAPPLIYTHKSDIKIKMEK